jgi:alkylation response protein AidB-like acyl-CoA dehydrogenase
MDLGLNGSEQKFRDELRTWLTANLPPKDKRPPKTAAFAGEYHEHLKGWQKKLYDGGYAGINWPKEYGGRGASFIEQAIFQEEMALADAPERMGTIGQGLVGPTIIAVGTEEQKKRYLPGILSGDEIWCQGFSEPNAGSDVASLETKGIHEGDDFVINGQKIWTSYAHIADWCLLLVRTDSNVPKHKGITCLLVDMKTPGITVRPVITIDGLHETNEVFFDDVRVPVGNLVGREGDGWKCAKVLLANERLLNGRLSSALHGWRRLKDRLGRAANGDVAQEHELARRLAWLEAEMLAMTMTQQRLLQQNATGEASSATEAMAAIVKIKGTEIRQGLLELAMLAAGPDALPYQAEELVADGAGDAWVADWVATSAASHCFGRAMSIYGGANEVQRNIVARRRLELG